MNTSNTGSVATLASAITISHSRWNSRERGEPDRQRRGHTRRDERPQEGRPVPEEGEIASADSADHQRHGDAPPDLDSWSLSTWPASSARPVRSQNRRIRKVPKAVIRKHDAPVRVEPSEILAHDVQGQDEHPVES
jgi:hypothetical protein